MCSWLTFNFGRWTESIRAVPYLFLVVLTAFFLTEQLYRPCLVDVFLAARQHDDRRLLERIDYQGSRPRCCMPIPSWGLLTNNADPGQTEMLLEALDAPDEILRDHALWCLVQGHPSWSLADRLAQHLIAP